MSCVRYDPSLLTVLSHKRKLSASYCDPFWKFSPHNSQQIASNGITNHGYRDLQTTESCILSDNDIMNPGSSLM